MNTDELSNIELLILNTPLIILAIIITVKLALAIAIFVIASRLSRIQDLLEDIHYYERTKHEEFYGEEDEPL